MVGSGQINGFAILEKDVFTQDYYTQIYLTAADAYDEIVFTDAYTPGSRQCKSVWKHLKKNDVRHDMMK